MRNFIYLLSIFMVLMGCGENEPVLMEPDESLRQEMRSLKHEIQKLKTLLTSKVEPTKIIAESTTNPNPKKEIDKERSRAISGGKITRMGEIGIFNESVGWTNVALAKADTEKILKTKFARSIKVYNDKAIGNFAKKNTADNKLDIIITFGYFPVSLYEPGNAEQEDSIAEKFLEGGDMFVNTADYIFYVTQGGGKNGDKGLKTITDSNFDCWGADADKFTPTVDGKKYVPSLPASYNSPRPMKTAQIKADKNWEVEVAFGSAKDGALLDPAVIKSTKHGGRFVVVRQTPKAAPDRGNVIREILENYVKKEIVPALAVDTISKLATTWSKVKNF